MSARTPAKAKKSPKKKRINKIYCLNCKPATVAGFFIFISPDASIEYPINIKKRLKLFS